MVDNKDEEILEELKKDSNQTTRQISKKTGIPITTIHNRIKKLEESNIITGYTVRLNHKKLGRAISAYILVSVIYMMPDGSKIAQEDIARKVSLMKEVENAEIVTGGTDMIIKVRVKDVDELNNFVIDKLRSVEGVDKTQTMVILNSF